MTIYLNFISVVSSEYQAEEMAEVAEASGMMNAMAQARADAALAARPSAPSIDIAAAEAELRDLMDGRVNG